MPLTLILPRKARRLGEAAEAVRRASDDALWREYRRTRSIELRNKLVERYADVARMTAERERSRLPGEVSADDLRQVANLALMYAVEKFNPDRGIKFETFCSLRLRGSIMDELRKMDWVPRLARYRAAQVDRQRNAFEVRHGRSPTSEELRRQCGHSEPTWTKISRDASLPALVSLERPCFDGDANRVLREIDTVRDDRSVAPEREPMRRDLLARLGRGLSRSEKLVIVLYYYEHLTMREIGEVLDLSESRVSQMHTSIISRLKSAAKGLEDDLADLRG